MQDTTPILAVWIIAALTFIVMCWHMYAIGKSALVSTEQDQSESTFGPDWIMDPGG